MMSSASGSLRAVLPHEPMTGTRVATRHGKTEISNDPEVILPTVTQWDQNFAVLDGSSGGGLELLSYVTYDEVRWFYEDRVAHERLVGAHQLSRVNSPWYVLTEVVGEYIMTDTGEKEYPHVAVLFATWPDGIIGEIIWTEPPWAKEMPEDWRFVGEVGHRLDALQAAWAANDVDAKIAQFEPNTRSAIRIVDPEDNRRYRAIAETNADLKAAWSSPEFGQVVEMESMDRVLTHFYAFASWRMIVELPHGRVERETAAIFPIGPDGGFAGELSYSFEAKLER